MDELVKQLAVADGVAHRLDKQKATLRVAVEKVADELDNWRDDEDNTVDIRECAGTLRLAGGPRGPPSTGGKRCECGNIADDDFDSVDVCKECGGYRP